MDNEKQSTDAIPLVKGDVAQVAPAAEVNQVSPVDEGK